MWVLEAQNEYVRITQSPQDNRFLVDYSQGNKIDFTEFNRNEMGLLESDQIEIIKGVRKTGLFNDRGHRLFESMSLLECRKDS
jgi:hypothetical protein